MSARTNPPPHPVGAATPPPDRDLWRQLASEPDHFARIARGQRGPPGPRSVCPVELHLHLRGGIPGISRRYTGKWRWRGYLLGDLVVWRPRNWPLELECYYWPFQGRGNFITGPARLGGLVGSPGRAQLPPRRPAASHSEGPGLGLGRKGAFGMECTTEAHKWSNTAKINNSSDKKKIL